MPDNFMDFSIEDSYDTLYEENSEGVRSSVMKMMDVIKNHLGCHPKDTVAMWLSSDNVEEYGDVYYNTIENNCDNICYDDDCFIILDNCSPDYNFEGIKIYLNEKYILISDENDLIAVFNKETLLRKVD